MYLQTKMKIIEEKSNRILQQDDDKQVFVNDGDIIEYTGIYYKHIYDIVETVEIETAFIGIVESCRYRWTSGFTGIYVKPLYIWNKIKMEWNKIVDFRPPNTKYFLYPHLLMVPEESYNFHPLYFLHTCQNRSLDEFTHITKTFCLDH